jgi:hypothetical protein
VRGIGAPVGARGTRGRTCPSARCEDGAVLLGIVATDGTLAYVRPQLIIDEDFVEAARRGRTPEARFRFAQPCVEDRCGQWNGNRCGLIDRIVASSTVVMSEGQSPASLPDCSIRPSCRWFAQRGANACAVCPLVVHSPAPTAAPDDNAPTAIQG